MSGVVAVLDLGATNTRLSAADADGRILETLSAPSAWLPGPPYVHRDLAGAEAFVAEGLSALGRRHRIAAIVPCAHGSGGVLVDDTGPVLPMMVYEQPTPEDVDEEFRRLAGSYRERGSPIMLGAAHTGRQMLWMRMRWPEPFARARWFLDLAQYWGWRLSGVAASEASMLGAQSNMWNVRDGCFTGLVTARGWQRLIAPRRAAWDDLGPLTPAWAARTGLGPDVGVLCGVHDSTANFYRYQAAGLRGFTMISTGTWIVGLSDSADPDALSERHGMTCNADVWGRPLAGVLCMGGREFTAVAGTPAAPGPVPPHAVAALIAAGTLAVPCFYEDDGMFPGRARRGYLEGPPPPDAAARLALAELYVTLLTDACLDTLGAGGTVVLDGPFVREPVYASLLAALRPHQRILVNRDAYGTGSGTALLAGHAARTGPAPVALEPARPLALPGLAAYRTRWRQLAAVRSVPPPTGTGT